MPSAFGDFMGGKVPDQTIVELSDDAKGLLRDGVNRAVNTDFGAQMNQGADERVSQLDQSDSRIDQQAAKTGADPAMLKALRDQYKSLTGDQVSKIKMNNELKAPLQKAKSLQNTAQAALGQQRAQNQFYAQLTDAYNQQEAGRAQFVNTLFQTGQNAYAANQANKIGQGQAMPKFNFSQSNSTQAPASVGGMDYGDMA